MSSTTKQKTLAWYTLDVLDRIRKMVAAEVAREEEGGPDFETVGSISRNPHLYRNLHHVYLRLNGGNLAEGDPEYAAMLPEINRVRLTVPYDYDSDARGGEQDEQKREGPTLVREMEDRERT